MNTSKNSHLWKIVVALGIIILVIVLWTKNTPATSATATPLVKSQTITIKETVMSPKPSRTPTPSPQASSKQNVPSTMTATAKAPTATPSPIPVYHIVEEGQVPVAIAAEYGISVDLLLTLNQISDPTRLQIGQQLLIPITVTPTPSEPSPTPTPTPEPRYHTIQAGDTLGAIAQQYDISLEILKFANNLSQDQTLQVNQKLLIPPSSIGFGTPTAIHTIKSGDTFDRLTYLYGSTIDDIIAANPSVDPSALRVGQQIIVPITSPLLNPEADPWLDQITLPAPMSAELLVIQQQVIETTNAQRESNGLANLSPDDRLTQIALAHAEDMVTRGFFAHVTPEGVNLRTRFAQHGVEANWVGENIQRNTQPADQSAANAIHWLMNSPPHRANMLHQHFTHLGVGVVEGPPGWYTFVMVFAQGEGL